jgi:hypothetical protein
MTALRVEIRGDRPAPGTPHVSGGASLHGTACPNCSAPLFPVFRLSVGDPSVRRLELWPEGLLEVLVCPRCALYLSPYWVHYGDGRATVHGGRRDGGEVIQGIDHPYDSRAIELRPLALGDGEGGGARRPRHQLGGTPFRRSASGMTCVVCGEPMRFAGVVDDDDENVPLYENGGTPVALVIGDCDCLHVFTCSACRVVGLSLARG